MSLTKPGLHTRRVGSSGQCVLHGEPSVRLLFRLPWGRLAGPCLLEVRRSLHDGDGRSGVHSKKRNCATAAGRSHVQFFILQPSTLTPAPGDGLGKIDEQTDLVLQWCELRVKGAATGRHEPGANAGAKWSRSPRRSQPGRHRRGRFRKTDNRARQGKFKVLEGLNCPVQSGSGDGSRLRSDGCDSRPRLASQS